MSENSTTYANDKETASGACKTYFCCYTRTFRLLCVSKFFMIHGGTWRMVISLSFESRTLRKQDSYLTQLSVGMRSKLVAPMNIQDAEVSLFLVL